MDYRIPVMCDVLASLVVIGAFVAAAQGNYVMWVASLSLSGILALTGRVNIIHQKITQLGANASKCQCSNKKDSEA